LIYDTNPSFENSVKFTGLVNRRVLHLPKLA
jgi:hypothetical protein